MFPLASQYIKPQTPASNAQGTPGKSEAAALLRRSLQHGSEAQPEQAEPAPGATSSGSSLENQLGVPLYCREGAPFLQVSPAPGSAVLFW